jgi:phenylalanyl-tRNA synthetase beta chain
VDARARTPLWMAERLRRSGIRPLSLLVDISQYVMLELGQPMHAFDLATLRGPIGVRRARAGESLRLLDGREVVLDPEFLAITDADRVVALAGLMGGMDTRVTDATTAILLEAAHFAPAAIIGRSRRLGLHTDAAHRFERGVDPDLPAVAIEYATRLILDHAGGRPGPTVIAERAEDLPTSRVLTLRRARLARVLGMAVDDADVARILGALGMQVLAEDAGWRVTVPPRRFDVAIEEDLIEEVARIHGYDRVPTRLPGGAVSPPVVDETRVGSEAVCAALRARDARQAICFSFVDAELLAHWGMSAEVVPLANPLSRELAVMRPSLLPGLVQALSRNLDRQQARVRLFETGRVFHAAQVPGESPRETERVALVVTGARAAESWANARERVQFADIKGDLESLASLSGARLSWRPSTPAWAHPGRSAEVWREDLDVPACLGWLGELHPRLAATLGLDQPVLACELDLDVLSRRELPRAGSLSRFPAVRRDLALIVADDVAWNDLERCIRETAGPLLRALWPFDLYQGPSIAAGRKSIAVGLILQDDSRTLTDHDVDAVTGAVTAALAGRFQARLRDQ